MNSTFQLGFSSPGKQAGAPRPTHNRSQSLFALILGAGFSLLLAIALHAQTAPVAKTQSIVQALQAHDNQKALQLAQELVQAYPSDPRVWLLQGITLQLLQRPDDSLASLEHALQLDPNNVPALKAAAQLEFQGNSPRAIPFLDRLLALNPTDQTAHAMTAALAFQQKDCATCVTHYQKSLQVIANDLSGLSQLGACLARLNRHAEALDVYQQIADLRPQDPEAIYYLGLAQYSAKHFKDAVQTLRPLAESGSEKMRSTSLNLLAAAYEDDQQTPLAVAALQKAIGLAPKDPDNYLDLATVSLDHGAFQLGIDVLNTGLEVVSNPAPLYLERGVLEVESGRFDEANADFRKAAELNPLQNYSSVALGISLLQENKPEESVKIVKQRLAAAPDDATLNYLLAELLIRTGAKPGSASFQEAEKVAERAVHTNPEFAPALDVLTELYLRSGKAALAEHTARLALKSDPSDQSALYHLIVCLRSRGDSSELPKLVQRLAEATAGRREQEKARSRFKLEEDSGSIHQETAP